MAAAAAASAESSPSSSSEHSLSRRHLSFVVLSHVDAGKTLLVANNLCNEAQLKLRRRAEEGEEESPEGGTKKQQQRQLDLVPSERSRLEQDRGITMNPALYQCTSSETEYTLIDSPGHRDFTKNLLRCISAADTAILIASADKRESDMAMSKFWGGFREMALLCYTMGLKRIIVAVSKMDSVSYQQARFIVVKDEVTQYLKKVGFNTEKNVFFVPISSAGHVNILSPARAPTIPWYTGPSLMAQMDFLSQQQATSNRTMHVVTRAPHLPLRLCIFSSIPLKKQPPISISDDDGNLGSSCHVLLAKVLVGTLRAGDMLAILAMRTYGIFLCLAERLEIHRKQVDRAVAGDVVGIQVTFRGDRSFAQSKKDRDADFDKLMRIERKMKKYHKKKPNVLHCMPCAHGPIRGVAGNLYWDPPRPTLRFYAQIILVNAVSWIKNGFLPRIAVGPYYVACRLRILTTVDKRTGQATSSFINPEEAVKLKHIVGDLSAVPQSTRSEIKNGDGAVVELTPLDPCFHVGAFADLKDSSTTLGRFAMFDLRQCMAVGVIKMVEYAEPVYKWATRKTALLIRVKSRNRFGEAFAVWNIMTTTALFLA